MLSVLESGGGVAETRSSEEPEPAAAACAGAGTDRDAFTPGAQCTATRAVLVPVAFVPGAVLVLR